MSFVIKNGKPTGIGRNVKFTDVPCDLKGKRRALFEAGYLDDAFANLNSREFVRLAKSDPVTFTYAMWRIFKEDAALATDKICDMAITRDPRDVIQAFEIMFFDAAPKINAFGLGYIISQFNDYVNTNPKKVKKAIKRTLARDFATTLRVMKGMYEASPKISKEIAKKFIGRVQYRIIKTLIKPMLLTRR